MLNYCCYFFQLNFMSSLILSITFWNSPTWQSLPSSTFPLHFVTISLFTSNTTQSPKPPQISSALMDPFLFSPVTNAIICSNPCKFIIFMSSALNQNVHELLSMKLSSILVAWLIYLRYFIKLTSWMNCPCSWMF